MTQLGWVMGAMALRVWEMVATYPGLDQPRPAAGAHSSLRATSCCLMFLSVFHRFKNVSLITKSIQTAMMLQTKFPRMVAGFDLVTVCTARQLFVTGPSTL